MAIYTDNSVDIQELFKQDSGRYTENLSTIPILSGVKIGCYGFNGMAGHRRNSDSKHSSTSECGDGGNGGAISFKVGDTFNGHIFEVYHWRDNDHVNGGRGGFKQNSDDAEQGGAGGGGIILYNKTTDTVIAMLGGGGGGGGSGVRNGQDHGGNGGSAGRLTPSDEGTITIGTNVYYFKAGLHGQNVARRTTAWGMGGQTGTRENGGAGGASQGVNGGAPNLNGAQANGGYKGYASALVGGLRLAGGGGGRQSNYGSGAGGGGGFTGGGGGGGGMYHIIEGFGGGGGGGGGTTIMLKHDDITIEPIATTVNRRIIIDYSSCVTNYKVKGVNVFFDEEFNNYYKHNGNAINITIPPNNITIPQIEWHLNVGQIAGVAQIA